MPVESRQHGPEIGGRRGPALRLRNPVLAASGCFGDGSRFGAEGWLAALGGFVTPTITPSPRRPRAGRLREAPAGVLYDPDVPNRGAASIGLLSRHWAASEAPVIVSIAAETPAGLAELLDELAAASGVAAVELNLAWPDLPTDEAESPQRIDAFVAAVVDATDLPLLVKLTPRPNLEPAVAAAAEAGADAVVVGHGWPALADPTALTGGIRSRAARLAGPAIRPLTLALIDELAGEADIGIIACGGVTTTADAHAYLAAGALAVQIGSALLRDPSLAALIATEAATRVSLTRGGAGASLKDGGNGV